MNNKILIEVCVDNTESVYKASSSGADRLELCSALALGGLTPSKGLIEYAVSHCKVPVFTLIRPRLGDFLFSAAEFQVIKSDIFSAKVAGVKGIVTGMLNPDGTIDTCRLKEVIEISHPLSVTFHRAFDMVRDQFEALEKLIELGCHRVLTSGGNKSAAKGSSVIAQLNRQADGRIIVMPGAGINEQNLSELIEVTECEEYHMSLSMITKGRMRFRNFDMEDTFPFGYAHTDSKLLEKIRKIADSFIEQKQG